MIVTEAEAAAKRCPLSFGPPLSQDGMMQVGAPAPFHGGIFTAVQTSPTHCIGSACMAWRWHWRLMPDGTHQHVLAAESDQRLGYCGMAGKP